MKNAKWKIRAFTLIELLIILTITGFLFTIGFVQYRKFANRQVLVNAHEKLKSDLNLIRQLTLSGEKALCGSTILQGYRISFTSSVYLIDAQCWDSNNIPSYQNLPDVDGQLPTGITLSSTQSPILFKVLSICTSPPSTILVLSVSSILIIN